MSGTKYSSVTSQLKRDNSHSQLNIFKESKAEIIKIFSEIFGYVNESNVFFQKIVTYGPMFQTLFNGDNALIIRNFVDKVEGIQHVINRNQMKCAFFGRTSNGKSTTINAMLGAKILPAGLGHTTSCFLEVQGTSESQGFIVVSPPPSEQGGKVEVSQPKPIDSIKELARDVSSNKLAVDALIKIFWPNQKCLLLCEDVVILDSPGIDVDPDIDKWIDMYCLDADVFVLVANSESILNNTEKKFFHNVKNKLSKPNIFILNNRWDASAGEIEYVKEARDQHTERCVSFLSKELKVCSKSEAETRVFFVSASEALNNRIRTSGDSSLPEGSFKEGWQSRYFEFQNFEKYLEKILSESATKTKFAAHSSQGQEIVSEVKSILDSLYEKSQEQKVSAASLTQRLREQRDQLEEKRKVAHKESLDDISRLSVKVAEQVARVLKKELSRINDVIEQFDRQFYDEEELLSKYKIDLSQHVEQQLGHNLASSCSNDLCSQVESVTKSILKRYLGLIPDKSVNDQMRRGVTSDYVPEYQIDCRNIYSDFKADLSFRFSLGASAILARSLAHPSTAGLDGLSSFINARRLLPYVTGRTIFGSVVVVGLMIKATGWKVLGVCAGLYGGLYLYEYTTWTVKAKERSFKTQFGAYVAEKLRLVMDFTSRQSATQPQYALKANLKHLNGEVDNFVVTKRDELARFEADIVRLEDIVTQSKTLKNKAIYFEKVLKTFHEKYILS